MRVEQGDLDPAYGSQFAGGSLSTPNNYTDFQRLGATARFAAGACGRSAVAAARDRTDHRSWPRAACEDQTADWLWRPGSWQQFKCRSQGRRGQAQGPSPPWLLGTRIGGVDNPAVVTGKPLFGIDVRQPASSQPPSSKCPVFGGKVRSANLEPSRPCPVCGRLCRGRHQQPERPDARRGHRGRAHLGSLSARKQLRVDWDEGPYATQSWRGFVRSRPTRSGLQPGAATHRRDGDVNTALRAAAKTVTARYEYPFISHASISRRTAPPGGIDGVMELWAPTQNPGAGQNLVASTLGIPKEQIKLHYDPQRRRLWPAPERRLHRRGRRHHQVWLRPCNWCGRAKTTSSTTTTGPAASTSCAAVWMHKAAWWLGTTTS